MSKGIKDLFPIQQECFYPIYDGKDLIGRDLTGSGKTLAFGLPLVEYLRKEKLLGTRKVQAIVLAPTRELAIQVRQSHNKISLRILNISFLNLKFIYTIQVQNVLADLKHYEDEFRTLTVYGGVPIEPQISQLRRGVEIFVGTTGRVLDHIERGNIDFRSIQTVILDEADVMFKLGFKEDVEKVTNNNLY